MRKSVKISLGVAMVLVGGLYFLTKWGNAQVTAELRDNPSGKQAQESMLLSFGDRTLPVNYLREGDKVFIGVDGPWWREFDPGPTSVKLLIQGEQFTGAGSAVRDNQAYVDEIFARLRPTAPEWLPDWLNGVLVVVDLDTSVTTQ